MVVVTLGLSAPWLRVRANDDAKPVQPEKTERATVAELEQQLKSGIFKLTEPDVVLLAGPPTSYKRPGDAGSELQLHWEYATFIHAAFKEGKLTDVTGGFSAHLPVEHVTLANFNKLRVGTTEAQAVEILGEGNGTTKVGSTVTRSWGRTGRLWVSINAKGKVFNPGTELRSAVYLPPGTPLPGLVQP
jgi:hypothetical protein